MICVIATYCTCKKYRLKSEILSSNAEFNKIKLDKFLSNEYNRHCDRIHSTLTTAFFPFDNGYEEEQPVGWKKIFAKYW